MTTVNVCDVCDGKTGDADVTLDVKCNSRSGKIHLHRTCVPEELRHHWVFQGPER